MKKNIEKSNTPYIKNDFWNPDIFEKLTTGFAICQVNFDTQGNAKDYKFLNINPAFEKQIGLQFKDVIGKTAKEIFPDIKQTTIDKYGNVIANNEPTHFIDYNKNTKKYYTTNAYPLPENKFVMTCEDITAKKKIEDKLLESQDQYNLLTNSMIGMFQVLELIYDKDDNVIDYYYLQVNPAFEKLVNMQKEEIVGNRAKDLFGIIEDHWLQTYKNVDKTGVTQEYENYGEELNKYYHIHAWKLGEKKIAVSFKDISETKGLLKALNKSEYRFRQALAHSHIVIFNQDKELRYTWIYNPLPDFDPDGILGKTDKDLIDLEDAEKLTKLKRKVLNTGIAIQEQLHLTINNKTFFYIVTVEPLYDLKENIIGISGVSVDITKQIQTENELLAAEKSDHLKSAFLANMSHEIRTPMNSILGFSSLLKKPNLTAEKKEMYCNLIEAGGKRLLNIITDIVDISKIDANQLSLNHTVFNLNDLIDNLQKQFNIHDANKVGKLNTKKGLTNLKSIIRSDKTRLAQILSNLLENSLKFTTKGSIEFGYSTDYKTIQFFVKDTGIGIIKEDQKKIFDRFKQIDTNYLTTSSGTGLGLTIVQSLTKLLKGDVWVESKRGKGSTFYFTIPYQPSDIEIIDINHQSLDLIKDEEVSILIAEDEHSNYLYIEALLEDSMCNLIHAKNGKEAVEMFNNNESIDLVLMDINMPIMNGIQATKEIRKKNKNVPIIAQTAHAFADDKQKVLKSGCNDYITKPISEIEIAEILNTYIKKSITRK